MGFRRPCTTTGCSALVRGEHSRCPQHRRDRRRLQDERRPTTRARGYGGRWRKVRDAYIRQHPLCERCEGRGITRLGEDVHHRDGDVLNLRPSNLETLCRPCHNRQTFGSPAGGRI